MNITSNLTVFFEAPFWVATFERKCEGKYEVSKIIFGQEPKDYEVYDFLKSNYSRMKFTDSIPCESSEARKINPKRLQRNIKKQIQNSGAGTMAQQAIKYQYENNKLEHKKNLRIKAEEKEKRKLNLRIQKKKEKHKGH